NHRKRQSSCYCNGCRRISRRTGTPTDTWMDVATLLCAIAFFHPLQLPFQAIRVCSALHRRSDGSRSAIEDLSVFLIIVSWKRYGGVGASSYFRYLSKSFSVFMTNVI